MIKVLFINNDGGGFADYVETSNDISVYDLFYQRMGENKSPKDYTIRVNRQPCPGSYILNEGDRVTFTPNKIDGNND